MDFNDYAFPDMDPQSGEAGFFRDVRETERAQFKRLEEQIKNLKASLSISEGLIALSQAPAYLQFLKAIQNMREFRMAELLASKTDRDSAIVIGRLRELNMIHAMLQNQQATREGLANQLKTAEDYMRQLMTRIPQEQNK